MKTFKEYIGEDVPTCSASGGAIASIGVGVQGEPPGKTAKGNKTLMFKRKPPEVVGS
jgi:hypothetical protein